MAWELATDKSEFWGPSESPEPTPTATTSRTRISDSPLYPDPVVATNGTACAGRASGFAVRGVRQAAQRSCAAGVSVSCARNFCAV